MNRKVYLVVFAYFIVYSLSGQKLIQVDPMWENFETRYFEVERIKYQEKNDSLIRNDTSRFVGEWKYKEFKNDEHILVWTLKDSFLPNEKHNKYLSGNLEVIYSADNSGKFKEIKNWSSIKNYFKEILKEIKEQGQGKLGYKLVKVFYTDKDYLLNVVGKEIVALHDVYGFDLKERKDTIRNEEETYNLLVEDPILTRISTYIEMFSPEENRTVYKRERKYDEDSANKVARKMLERYAGKSDEEIEEFINDIRFNIEKLETYEYQTNDPVRIELEQRTITELGVENSLKIKKTVLKKMD